MIASLRWWVRATRWWVHGLLITLRYFTHDMKVSDRAYAGWHVGTCICGEDIRIRHNPVLGYGHTPEAARRRLKGEDIPEGRITFWSEAETKCPATLAIVAHWNRRS